MTDCRECGATLPRHYDSCSRYRESPGRAKMRAAAARLRELNPPRDPLVVGSFIWKPSALFGPDSWRIEGAVPGSDQGWTVYAMSTNEAHEKTARMLADGFLPTMEYRTDDTA